jgi:hypothetical protein
LVHYYCMPASVATDAIIYIEEPNNQLVISFLST